MTQCTKTCLGAAGSGASGSSTTTATLFVAGGGSLHASGGDVSAPSQVYFDGIGPFGGNAADVTVSVATTSPGGGEKPGEAVVAAAISFVEQPAPRHRTSAANAAVCTLHISRS